MTKEESKKIDAVRTMANYLIVLMHAYAAYQYGVVGSGELNAWNYVCNAVTTVAMPALFFLSGYLLMREFSIDKFPEKIARRVKRLLIPYLAWNFSFVAFYIVASKFVPRLAQRVETFGLATLSGISSKTMGLITDPIDLPTWFMRTIFFYSLLAPFFYLLLKKRRAWLLYLLIAVWWCASTLLGWGDVMRFTYPVYSLICFTLGCHMSLLGRTPFDLFKSKCWMLPSVLGIVGVGYYIVVYHWDYSILRDIAFTMEMPFLFCLAPILVRLAEKIPFFDFLKRSAFFLYTGHFLFCSIVLHLIAPGFAWIGEGKVSLLILMFCTLGVAVNLIVYWVGKKLLGKMFGIWDGTL